MKRILSVLLVLILLAGMLPLSAQHAHAADTTVTLTVTGTTGTKSSDSSSISWTNSDVTFTNEKGSTAIRTSDSAHYRIYAGSSATITAPGNITKIVVTCTGSSYATVFATSCNNTNTGTATVSGSAVTIVPTTAEEIYSIDSFTAQTRVTTIEVTYSAAGCAHSNLEKVEANAATCTEDGNIAYWYCGDCEKYFSDAAATTEITEAQTKTSATGHNYVLEGTTYTCSVCGDKYETFNISFSVQGVISQTVAYTDGGIELPGAEAPDGYTFAGWTTGTVEATTTKPTVYAAGATFTATEATTLYALYSYAVEGEGSSNTFTLYSGDITEGDYLIVYDGAAMNTTVSSSRLQYATVTITNNTITTDNTAIIWHIAPDGDYWTLYNEAGNIYAAGTGANNKATTITSLTDYGQWTITGNTTYEIVNAGNTGNKNLRRNGTYGFACYSTSTGGALSLYKAGAGSTTYYTTEFAEAPCEHSNTATTTVDATCTEAGAITVTCNDCGETVSTTPIAALGHDYEVVVTTTATCTAVGEMTYTCKNDSTHSYTEEIPMIDHNYVDGVCSACGAEKPQVTEYKLVSNETIAAGNFVIGAIRSGSYPAVYLATSTISSGDLVVGDTAISATNDTITSLNLPEGTQVFTLEGNNTDGFTIGYNNGTEMVYLGYTSYASRKLAFSASYNTFLWTLQVNENGEFYLQTITDAGKYLVSQNSTGTGAIRGYANNTVYTGIYLFGAMCDHSYGEGVVTDPTCTTDGYTTYTCSKCGSSYTDNTVAALGHDFENGTVTKNPSCTEEGTKKCARCDATQAIPATGHTPGDSAEVIPATCEEKGSKTYTCTVCSTPIVEEIPALGHKYDNGVEQTPATCTADGVKLYTCQNDATHTYTEAIPALGHNYVDGVCTNCGCEVERFQLVTDITDILEGGRFVIAALSNDTYYAMDMTLSGGELDAVEVTVEDGFVTYQEGVPVWKLGAIDGKSISLYNGEYYLGYGTDGTSFKESAGEYPWIVRQNDNGTAYITYSSEFADRAISLTTMGSFKPYSTTQPDYNRNLFLFKVVTDETVPSVTLTFKENNTATMVETVANGNVFQMPEPSKAIPTGYEKFIGWVTLPTAETLVKPTTIYKAGEFYMVTGDRTFYALYSRYDANEEGLAMVYHPVTDQSQITLGGKYLIVSSKTTNDVTTYYAMQAAQRSNNRGSVIVTMNEDGTITVDSDVNAAVLQLDNGTVDGTYALLDIKMDMYLYGSSDGYLRSTSEISSTNSNAYSFVITINSDGTATMESQSTADRRFIKFNPTAMADGVLIFNTYKETSTNNPVSLYYGVSTDSGATFYSTIICEHNYVKDSAASKDPTCTDSGYARYTCSLCGDTYVEVLPATGHTMSEDATIKTPATCTASGVASYTCTVCGVALEDEVIPATGHNFGKGVGHPAENGQTAYIQYTCQNENCGESYKTELKFETASLTVANKLSLNFKVPAAVFADGAFSAEGVKAVFTLGYRVGDKALTVDEYTIEEDEKGLPKYYVFECFGINPSQIGDMVTATLYANYDGTTYESLALTEYSVVTYCENMLRSGNAGAELKTLLVDLLNYGTAAKIYTKYYTEVEKASGVQILPNAGLTEEEQGLGTAENPAVNNVYKINAIEGSANTVAWKAAGLVLNNSVTMRFRFEAPQGVEGLYVVLQMGSNGYVLKNFVADTTRENQYYVYFNALKAYQLNETVILTVRDQNNNIVSNQLVYSVASYVANKTASATVADDFKALLWAMMKYGNSAKAYIEANS